MSEAFKRLAQWRFAGSSAKLYDVPSSTETIIKAINISNNTGTAREVTLYHCDNGDTPDDEQIILPGVSIAAGGFAEWEGTLTMAALKLRAQIFIIPEHLNIESKAQEAQNDRM